MIKTLVDRLQTHNEAHQRAYGELTAATLSASDATQRAAAAQVTLRKRESELLAAHAAGTINLGTNEQARTAQLRELAATERAARDDAQAVERAAQLRVVLAQTFVEAAGVQLRTLEGVVKLAAVSPAEVAAATLAPLATFAPAPRVESPALTPAARETFSAARELASSPAISPSSTSDYQEWRDALLAKGAEGEQANPEEYQRQLAAAALTPSAPAITYDHLAVGDLVDVHYPGGIRAAKVLELPAPGIIIFEEEAGRGGKSELGGIPVTLRTPAIAPPSYALPDMLPLADGSKIELACAPAGNGRIAVTVTRKGKRGGAAKKLGELGGPPEGRDWGYNCGMNGQRLADWSWGDALSALVTAAGYELATPMDPSATTAEIKPIDTGRVSTSRGSIAAATERILAGTVQAGDGKQTFGGVAWQESGACWNVLVTFMGASIDATEEMIGQIAGQPYADGLQVDTEALGQAAAAYFRDRALVSEPAAPAPTAPAAVEDNPRRIITDAEAEAARAQAEAVGIGPGELDRVIREECEPETNLFGMHLDAYRHLTLRVLPALASRRLAATPAPEHAPVERTPALVGAASTPTYADDLGDLE